MRILNKTKKGEIYVKKRFKILLAFILSVALVVTHIPLISAEEIFGSKVKDNTQQEEITQQNEDAYILGELIEKRSNDTKHFRMSDGSIKACVYPHDVHYLKNGNFEDIDNTLIYDEEKGVPVFSELIYSDNRYLYSDSG